MTIEHILVFLICIIGFAEAIYMAVSDEEELPEYGLVDWEELPISVRRSPRKLYRILENEFDIPYWNELPVTVRRSLKRRYYVISEFLTDLPPWEDLSVIDRRSHKRLYRIIKSVYEGDYYDSPGIEEPPLAVLAKEIPEEEEPPK